MSLETKQIHDQIVAKFTRMLVEKGLNVKEVPVFVTEKGAIAVPDIFFKRGNEYFALEVKTALQLARVERDFSWEDAAQTQSNIGIVQEAINLPVKGILVLAGAKPSDALNKFAEEQDLKIISLTDVDIENLLKARDEGLRVLADDIFGGL